MVRSTRIHRVSGRIHLLLGVLLLGTPGAVATAEEAEHLSAPAVYAPPTSLEGRSEKGRFLFDGSSVKRTGSKLLDSGSFVDEKGMPKNPAELAARIGRGLTAEKITKAVESLKAKEKDGDIDASAKELVSLLGTDGLKLFVKEPEKAKEAAKDAPKTPAPIDQAALLKALGLPESPTALTKEAKQNDAVRRLGVLTAGDLSGAPERKEGKGGEPGPTPKEGKDGAPGPTPKDGKDVPPGPTPRDGEAGPKEQPPGPAPKDGIPEGPPGEEKPGPAQRDGLINPDPQPEQPPQEQPPGQDPLNQQDVPPAQLDNPNIADLDDDNDRDNNPKRRNNKNKNDKDKNEEPKQDQGQGGSPPSGSAPTVKGGEFKATTPEIKTVEMPTLDIPAPIPDVAINADAFGFKGRTDPLSVGDIVGQIDAIAKTREGILTWINTRQNAGLQNRSGLTQSAAAGTSNADRLGYAGGGYGGSRQPRVPNLFSGSTTSNARVPTLAQQFGQGQGRTPDAPSFVPGAMNDGIPSIPSQRPGGAASLRRPGSRAVAPGLSDSIVFNPGGVARPGTAP